MNKNQNQKILFLCPEIKSPSGGVKQIYRQVDILNSIGYESHVVHQNIKFKITWFKNSTSIRYNFKSHRLLNNNANQKNSWLKKLYLQFRVRQKSKNDYPISSSDILVFPEFYGKKINFVFPNNNKVIYNQGCYLTFKNHSFNSNTVGTPYLNTKTLATLVNSDDGKKYLNHVFPQHKVLKIRHCIDTSFFVPKKNKKKQIAYMSRKNYEDIRQLICILSIRNVLNDWELIDIDNKSHLEVAEIFSESLIFLSSNGDEGFPLPSIEAMASGCLVIGYTGKGGDEYFKPEFSVPVTEKNVQEFAIKAEKWIKQLDQNESYIHTIGEKARTFISANYNEQNEYNDIKNAWSSIFESINKLENP